ncbi:hypothetical protein [Acetobacter fallax]|uniref:hypothetical protein n=1 Tax=Acetobacter fallax TaxID=1737473 RepID=UPI001F54F6A9|nr:hypothetical protein [Acetobacter fallax]
MRQFASPAIERQTNQRPVPVRSVPPVTSDSTLSLPGPRLLLVAGCLAASLIAVPALMIGAAQARTHHVQSHKGTSGTSTGKPVILSQQPGTDLDKQARILNADDIATSRRHHEEPVLLIGSAPLSTKKGEIALFVQLQSAALCGSAGCSTDVYLRTGDDWVKVLDSVSGSIAILPTSHRGMYDIVVDGTDRWIWHGDSYQDTISAAPVGNLRSEIQQFQKKKGISATSGN